MTVRSLALVPVCLVWILSFGCASAKLTVIHPLPAPESRVTLSIEESSQIHSEQLSGLRTILTTRLKQGGVSVVGGRPPDVHDLSAELTEYDPGSRALRYWIGLGAGRGSLDTTWTVRDESSEPIGVCQIIGSITMGVFGGNWDDVLVKVGDLLAQCLTGEK